MPPKRGLEFDPSFTPREGVPLQVLQHDPDPAVWYSGEPQVNHNVVVEARRPGRIKRALTVGTALVAVAGVANLVSDLTDWDWGRLFGHHPTELSGGVGNVRTEVEEYHGIVSAKIESKVDLDLERNLHRVVVPDCHEEVHEHGLPLSGLLVTAADDITVTQRSDTVDVSVARFDAPELGLPLDRPVLSEGDSWNICIQKTGKEDKKNSPENVPVMIAGQLLEAASKRIGECVINQANDEGSAVQKLLTTSIATQIAHLRGIDPRNVHVSFDFKDSDEGKKAIEEAIDNIVKTQKEETGADVSIDTAEVASCRLQKITAVLAPNAPSK